MFRYLSVSMICLGLVLLAVSFIWTRAVGAWRGVSEQEFRAYESAALEIHDSRVGDAMADVEAADVWQATAAMEAARREVDRQQRLQEHGRFVLHLSGATLALVGVGIHLWQRRG